MAEFLDAHDTWANQRLTHTSHLAISNPQICFANHTRFVFPAIPSQTLLLRVGLPWRREAGKAEFESFHSHLSFISLT